MTSARTIGICAVRLVIVSVLLMGPVSDVYSQAAGAFSRMGFGARGIALGNALSADVGGIGSPYYNPALAPYAKRQNLEATVALLNFDRSLQFLQLASPLRRNAGIAVGLIHASVDNIDGRDNSGFHTQDLSIDEFAGFLAFGIRKSDVFSAGIAIQFFRTDLFDGLDPGVSVGIDIGLTVQLIEGVHAAFVLDDLLARYQWNTDTVNGSGGKRTTDNFPTRLRIGLMTTRLHEKLRFVAEVESRFTKVEAVSRSVTILGSEPAERANREDLILRESRFRAGAEYEFLPQFVIRGGVEQLGKEALGGVRPSAGFMIEQEVGTLIARFEYAFSYESPASGTMHLFTLRMYL